MRFETEQERYARSCVLLFTWELAQIGDVKEMFLRIGNVIPDGTALLSWGMDDHGRAFWARIAHPRFKVLPEAVHAPVITFHSDSRTEVEWPWDESR